MSSTLSFIFFLVSVIYISSCFLFHVSTSRPTGFSSRIINRNSVESPFYNANTTRSDRIRASVRRSFARSNHLQFLISKKASASSIVTQAWQADGEYVMEYFIGTPPVRTYAILDTGSPTTWLQCLPCQNCFYQAKVPLFEPSKSSSYKPLSCRDLKCHRINPFISQCSTGHDCKYEVRYGGGFSTVGDVAEETLHFHNDIGNVTMENIVIGCGRINTYNMDGEGVPGVIGLMSKHESIVEQMSFKRFAYCFGDPDETDARSYAKFGQAASVTGLRTPIISAPRYLYPNFYFLNLEGISVDNLRLWLPDGTFDLKPQYASGFIIDSGAQYTHINSTAFRMLVGELRYKLQNQKRVGDPNEVFELCYEMYGLDLTVSPVITFHFTGLDLELPQKNTWFNVQDNIYCLAMHPTEGVSVLGHFQQQNFNVGYDLENRAISFDLMYCADNWAT